MVFIKIFFLSLFQRRKNSRKEKRKNKKGKEGKKEVKSRDKITVFPLWRPVPQGRDVAKCDPDHDQRFLLIIILVFLA